MTSIFDEYRKFAGTKVLADQEVSGVICALIEVHQFTNFISILNVVYRNFRS